MTSSAFGIATKNTWIVLLNKLTNSTQPSNSRPKYQRTKLLSSTQLCSKGKRFTKDSILDIKTHYKPTETFQYTHFTSCHPPGVKKGFIKGEAMRLLRTNSSKTSFEECLMKFKQRLQARGYPKTLVERSLSGVTFASRQSALTKKKHDNERLLPFVTTYQPAVKKNWNKYWWNNGAWYKISHCWKQFTRNLRLYHTKEVNL